MGVEGYWGRRGRVCSGVSGLDRGVGYLGGKEVGLEGMTWWVELSTTWKVGFVVV